MDKSLFSTQTPLTRNNAGGVAYEMKAGESLAQYAVTGFFGDTFYTSAQTQLEEIGKLCASCDEMFIARCAVYARKHGDMKDMPAYLLAVLCARMSTAPLPAARERAREAFVAAFPGVIDNGLMLRNFAQVIRSGVTGRKNFGALPRRMMNAFLISRATHAPAQLFKDAIGEKPSLSDVIKMVHPAHKPGSQDEALFGYIIGKKYDAEKLPPIVRAYEAFKAAPRGELERDVPPVDFRMVASLELTSAEWRQVARHASWTVTKKNLATFKRHGVFEDPEMVEIVANRLRDRDGVLKSREFPYQILTAYRKVAPDDVSLSRRLYTQPAPKVDESGLPPSIVQALHDAMDIAVEKLPRFPGFTVVCPDVSGSMQSPVTGSRGAPTRTRVVDVAGLMAAAIMRNSEQCLALPFDTRVHAPLVGKEPKVMDLANAFAALGGGGTECALPLRALNERNLSPDAIVFISDNESWAQSVTNAYNTTTPMQHEWQRLLRRNPKAKLVLIDITAGTTSQVKSQPGVLHIGGFSDAVFDVIARFLSGETKSFVDIIQSTTLSRI